MDLVNGNILMELIYMREILVLLIVRIMINGEDQINLIKDQIKGDQKLEKLIIIKILISNNIGKEKMLLIIMRNSMSLLEIMFIKKVLIQVTQMQFLTWKFLNSHHKIKVFQIKMEKYLIIVIHLF